MFTFFKPVVHIILIYQITPIYYLFGMSKINQFQRKKSLSLNWLYTIPLPLLEVALLFSWSSGFIGARFSINYAPALLVVFWRYVLLTLLLLPFVYRPLLKTPPRVLMINAGIGLLAMVGYMIGVTQGIALGVPAGLAALCADLLPLGMALVATAFLGERLPQAEDGDMLYERAHHQSPSRHPGYVSSPPSMRIAGGMRQLTERLEARIAAEQVVTDARVIRIERTVGKVQVHTVSSDQRGRMFTAQAVLLALPPALAARIEYLPALPARLTGEWAGTGTWMAPHAKYVAIYEHDFWQQAGLSGEARSGVGPMAEIHDASVPGRVSALFGFIGIPARSRWTTSEENLKLLCRAQLIRLFGEKAGEPVAEYLKDWADDPFTATEKDLLIQAGHTVPAAYPDHGAWADCLRGIGSEWSAQFPWLP